jgi:hypothetical protein
MRRQLALVAIIALLAAGCAWPAWLQGPLALAGPAGDDARRDGLLQITETCVFVETAGEKGLVVWPADRTRWNATDGSISFTTLAGREVRLVSGQHVVLAGGGVHIAEAGADWVERVTWVRRPAPECLTDGAWFVSDVL